GHEGLVILDIEKPEQPVIDQVFNAGGQINDVRDVKLGITYTSQFAYLADGHNGLRVVQLTSTDTPGYQGFSPRPTPVLVASKKMPKNGHALAIAEGIDRDRAVDESGNQIAVFGRWAQGHFRWPTSRKCIFTMACSGRCLTTRDRRFTSNCRTAIHARRCHQSRRPCPARYLRR
ncbi:MAG: hypothetical protein ACKO0V_10695, partial [bacterium]